MASQQKTILVTQRLPNAVENRLSRDYDAILNHGAALTQEQIVSQAHKADGLLVTVTDQIDSNLVKALPNRVKIIANFGVGYEHIDIKTAGQSGIVVTNTPGVLTEATADIALLLLLGAARRAGEGHVMMRAGDWHGWTPTSMIGHDITGKRLGIVGLGRIGQAVARRARAFNIGIHYHNRHRLPLKEEAGAHYHDSLESLLAISDFLSLHAALTPQTQGLLNTRTLSLLPRGAIVINTARGDLVDDAALVESLQSGHVAAAGLDVFSGEPHIHPGYTCLDNVFLLPHLGSATTGTRNAMGFCALDNLDAFFSGQEPPHLVTL